jgi:histidinol dehydrogenase
MSAQDLLLEMEIDKAYQAVCDAKTEEALAAAWQRMRELHGQRSPEQVDHMERQQGLR